MAMINQLRRRNGTPTPYFVVGAPGMNPYGTAYLMWDYTYPCSPHCRGIQVAPWQGTAAAVAPMIPLDLDWQWAKDQMEFAATPHRQLDEDESRQWRRHYDALMRYNPEEPRNEEPREALRTLHIRATHRQEFWANLSPLAPAPPRGMPPA